MTFDGVQNLTLTLPEPPSLNKMLDLAKERTRRTRSGGWMKRAIPVVYDQTKDAYDLQCLAAIRGAGVRPPASPWPRWQLEAVEFRLHRLRDPIELLAGLKWPIDFLVSARFVEDDSPRELIAVPYPTQLIDQSNRRITLTISRAQ
jgi:hypothetical protein